MVLLFCGNKHLYCSTFFLEKYTVTKKGGYIGLYFLSDLSLVRSPIGDRASRVCHRYVEIDGGKGKKGILRSIETMYKSAENFEL